MQICYDKKWKSEVDDLLNFLFGSNNLANDILPFEQKIFLKKEPLMKKLMIIFIAVLVVVFAIGMVYVMKEKKEDIATSNYNPYDKEDLNVETIKLLDNPDYQSIITMKNLEEKIATGNKVFAYFFGPTCGTCKEATPLLMPVAKELGVQVDQLNMLEYQEGWQKFNIEETPVLAVYQDGKEIARTQGNLGTEGFKAFISNYK